MILTLGLEPWITISCTYVLPFFCLFVFISCGRQICSQGSLSYQMISVLHSSQRAFALAFLGHPQLRDLSSAGLWH